MKAMMIAASALLLGVGAANAQTESGAGNDIKELKKDFRKEEKDGKRNDAVVSYQTHEAFMRDFKDVSDATWKVSPLFQEATFQQNGSTVTAYYDFDSELVGTTTLKAFDDIPAKAKAFIEKHYAGYTPGEVVLFDDNEANDTDMELYNTIFDDEDNYFVSMKNDKESIVLKVNTNGAVTYFKKL